MFSPHSVALLFCVPAITFSLLFIMQTAILFLDLPSIRTSSDGILNPRFPGNACINQQHSTSYNLCYSLIYMFLSIRNIMKIATNQFLYISQPAVLGANPTHQHPCSKYIDLLTSYAMCQTCLPVCLQYSEPVTLDSQSEGQCFPKVHQQQLQCSHSRRKHVTHREDTPGIPDYTDQK